MSAAKENLPAIVSQHYSLEDTMKMAENLAKSGFFPDGYTAAKAYAKILAGREMGFGPIASLTNIYIIDNKPSIGASLLAAKIKGSGRYDYDLITCTKDECELEFHAIGRNKKWESVGKIKVLMKDLEAQGITKSNKGVIKDNYRRAPDDMLFARAIGKGFRRFCPDLIGGVIAYDPDELDRDPQPNLPTIPATVADQPEPQARQESEPPPAAPSVLLATGTQLDLMSNLLTDLAGTDKPISEVMWQGILSKRGALSADKLTAEQAAEIISHLERRKSEAVKK